MRTAAALRCRGPGHDIADFGVICLLGTHQFWLLAPFYTNFRGPKPQTPKKHENLHFFFQTPAILGMSGLGLDPRGPKSGLR